MSIPAVVGLLARRIWWPILVVPPIAAVILCRALDLELASILPAKNALELTALLVLWTAVGVAAIRTIVCRAPFLFWLTLLAGILLFREYHLFKQATTIVYVLLFALGIALLLNYARMAGYLESRCTISMFAFTLVCYMTTQTMDIDAIKFGRPENAVVEEFIEVAGHLSVLAVVLFARAKSSTPAA